MSKKCTQEEFEEKLKDATNDAFDVIGEYIANDVKIALRCHKCGQIIYKRPSKMTSSRPEGCYFCTKKNRWKTTESFSEEVEERYPGQYVILGEYIKAREPLLVQHLRCGHTYKITPDNLLRGKGCPYCSNRFSTYASEVEHIFAKYNFKYEREKRYSDCKYKRVLPFDYYLPEYNACIEVDGEYHFQPSYGEEKLHIVQERDQIKEDYCRQHGIPLLRLPYFEQDNFENLICAFVSSLQPTQANTEVSA